MIKKREKREKGVEAGTTDLGAGWLVAQRARRDNKKKVARREYNILFSLLLFFPGTWEQNWLDAKHVHTYRDTEIEGEEDKMQNLEKEEVEGGKRAGTQQHHI